jgi:hypothetical protein
MKPRFCVPEFLQLPSDQRSAFLNDASKALGRAVPILEKDIWVCWALEALFKLEHPRMVFKGGTSLSKVFKSIERFSEDIDVTIDHRASHDPINDPLEQGISKTKLREFSERMKVFTAQQVMEVIKPHLEDQARGVPIKSLKTNADQNEILIEYHSADREQPGYVLPTIKLEFGARNAIEPSAYHQVEPDVVAWQAAQVLGFPKASIPVLAAERTFWEKITLIHAENTRRNAKLSIERYSRHWYDLARLAVNQIGTRGLQDTVLRDDVIHTKTVLFGLAGVDYSQVQQGKCQLVPVDDFKTQLERDYVQMVNARMFDGEAPSFQSILEVLGDLELKINTRAKNEA